MGIGKKKKAWLFPADKEDGWSYQEKIVSIDTHEKGFKVLKFNDGVILSEYGLEFKDGIERSSKDLIGKELLLIKPKGKDWFTAEIVEPIGKEETVSGD